MLSNIEPVAVAAGLHLANVSDPWTAGGDSPHIAAFRYELRQYDDENDSDELRKVGMVDGYRITQDWTVKDELQIWDEADALAGDAVRYVEALIREVRVCEECFPASAYLSGAQRVTIVRHVEAVRGVDLATLTRDAVASIAMMDAPVIMLVDPWPMSTERQTATGKLRGRSHSALLLELGFLRMVASRFLWAWNRELADALMADYSYDTLIAAKRSGKIGEILRTALCDSVYGKMPKEIWHAADLPEPDELMDE